MCQNAFHRWGSLQRSFMCLGFEEKKQWEGGLTEVTTDHSRPVWAAAQ